MIAHRRSKKFDPEEDETAYFETQFKICRRCKQEYTGACPISSASCPMEAEESDATEEEDEGNDFDDVENLNEVLTKDEEADEAAEEDGEIPAEDLEDDD